MLFVVDTITGKFLVGPEVVARFQVESGCLQDVEGRNHHVTERRYGENRTSSFEIKSSGDKGF